MKGAGVVGILLVVHGDVLVKSRKSSVTLLSVRPNTKWVVVRPVRLVVNEGSFVGCADISALAIVVASAVVKLAVTVGQRLSELLSSHIHVRVEVDVPQTHTSCQSEAKGDGPDIVVTGDVVEERPETPSDGPFEQHWIRCSGEEQESSIPEPLY